MKHWNMLAVVSIFLNIKFEMLNIKHPTENDKQYLKMQKQT